MASKRWVGGLLLASLVLAGGVAGATYAALLWRERRTAKDLTLARSLLAQRDFDRAGRLLAELREQGRGKEAWFPEVLLLQLELAQRQADRARGIQVAETLLDPQRAYRGEPRWRALAYLGQAALDDERVAEARSRFETLLTEAGAQGPGADAARLGLARLDMAERGVTVELIEALSQWLEDFPESSVRPEAEYALGRANVALLLSPVPGPGDQIYALERGDNLYSLARRFGVSEELLSRVNGITDPRRLSIGRRLKIPDLDLTIEVDKTRNVLTLYNRGRFFKRYPVRTGKVDYLTPPGDYKILSKTKNPQWTDPRTGKVYAPNHPENELGTRWLGFQGGALGIHGTIHPETIGTYASFGCVGLLPEDVEELFDLVRIGTPVKIIGRIAEPPRIDG